MAQVIIPDGFGQITVEWTQQSAMGSIPANVFGVLLTGAFDITDIAFIPDAFQFLANPLDSSWAVENFKFTLGAAGGPPYVSFDIGGGGVTGTATGSSQVPSVACLVKKISLVAGRQGRGRMYLPGVPEGEVDDQGVLTQTFRDDVKEGWDTMVATLATNNMAPVYILHGEGTPLAETPSEVVSVSVPAVAATQRRRLRS